MLEERCRRSTLTAIPELPLLPALPTLAAAMRFRAIEPEASTTNSTRQRDLRASRLALPDGGEKMGGEQGRERRGGGPAATGHQQRQQSWWRQCQQAAQQQGAPSKGLKCCTQHPGQNSSPQVVLVDVNLAGGLAGCSRPQPAGDLVRCCCSQGGIHSQPPHLACQAGTRRGGQVGGSEMGAAYRSCV